ncbi:MAG: zinc ribbon domain-containing protein [Pseudomonadota bacterium]|uniref:Zinc ribbon domain-containing protein n=1 Tax=Candidatus Desulfatibia profunda TaxID=2841695 RepID=A0A8J6TLY5_9BACT|nr:zinc ribbon domain-containing protein [Candidatus Desulfatibia profunda]MBL7178685.1 zinc ribbon domain-containing protein [Desulfobacterales bacterium]
MPIYEYRCGKCDKVFEYLVLSSSEVPNCPACQSKKVNKLMSAPTFFSKGSSGMTERSSAGASSCSGCAATSCTSCSH